MKIGVIGGNGVAATNRLCDIIERKLTAKGAFRDAHHPEMIIWQATKAPSRSMFLEGKGEDWRPDYIRIAKTLKAIGCDIACMCCNTAHYAIDDIANASELQFINLLEEVAVAAKASGGTRFEVFCSDGLRKFDLYGKVFKKVFPAATIVYPSDRRQREVTSTICGVKNQTRLTSDINKERLERLILEAEAPVILGCTDLRVAYKNDEWPVNNKLAVDSLECLADAIVRTYGAAIDS